MIWIRDTSTVPVEGWRYPSINLSRETDITAPSYSQLFNNVDRHYTVNGVPPPSEQDVIQWLCDNLTVPCLTEAGTFDNNWTRREPTPIDMRPVPYADWPLWAKSMKLVSSSEDKGVGDTIRRLIGDSASDAFKAWYRSVFGGDCGCAGRQDKWNAQYGY